MSKCRSIDPIGIFDSGFGGLSVLKEFEKILPKESLLFLADSSRIPYGERTSEELIEFSLDVASTLNQLGIKMLVVACHTASICALDALKKHCAIPVIGINEIFGELLLQAAPKKALLLGTKRTILSGYYSAFLPESTIIPCACGDFVQAIEQGIEGNSLLPLLLEKYLMKHANEPFESLLLACTHFPFIKQHILDTLHQNIPCLDPAPLLAERVKTRLESEGILAEENPNRFVHFYTTGDPQHFAERGGKLIGIDMSPENVFELIKEDEEILL